MSKNEKIRNNLKWRVMNKSKTIKANKKVFVEYLECVSKMLSSRIDIEGYILSHGTLFIGREPSKNVVVPSFKPKSKQCYYNSQLLALEENIQYIEGYAFDGLLPLEHAWCVSDGKVIDVTWEVTDRKNKENHDQTCIYYGIEIPKGFVWENMSKRELAEQLIYKFIKSCQRW